MSLLVFEKQNMFRYLNHVDGNPQKEMFFEPLYIPINKICTDVNIWLMIDLTW